MTTALSDKTALVTGGTAGIGFHIAAGLASRGARVFLTGRDAAAGKKAVAELRAQAGHEHITFVPGDGSLVAGNLALAGDLSKRIDRLDLLINNVGGCFSRLEHTTEGFELTLALNFIGPLTLTDRLLPLLPRDGSARIVNVLSSAFQMWKGDPFENLDGRDGFVGLQAYAHAKLLNLLASLALARRLESPDGKTIHVALVNPGMAWTPSNAALTKEAVPQWRYIWPLVRWFQRRAPAASAARGPLLLATRPDPVSARYFDEAKEKPLPRKLLDSALQDRALALASTLAAGVSPTTKS